MNKNFILENKTNNSQKNASGIVKFNLETKDYIINCIDEDNENNRIFVSRLILNSEGKYFIENILPEEKNKLSKIIYDMIMMVPLNAKKGINSEELIKNLTEKNMLKLSCDIPELNIQEYIDNCSIAIVNNNIINEAKNFYELNLKEEKEENIQNPVWTLPITEEEKKEPVIASEPVLPVSEITPIPVVSTPEPVVEPEIIVPVEPIANSEVQIQEPVLEVKEEIKNDNIVSDSSVEVIQPATPEVQTVAEPITSQPVTMPSVEPTVAPITQEPITQSVPAATPDMQAVEAPVEVNPQTAIMSDPSLSEATGISMQQNNVQQNIGQQKVKTLTLKKAGFAINKYIVIGTLCILLSIAVVIIAYILIKKKTTGV